MAYNPTVMADVWRVCPHMGHAACTNEYQEDSTTAMPSKKLGPRMVTFSMPHSWDSVLKEPPEICISQSVVATSPSAEAQEPKSVKTDLYLLKLLG